MMNGMCSVAVGALEGKIELYLETSGPGSVSAPIPYEPTHEGLMAMWALFQAVGSLPIHFMPEIADTRLTGLPKGVDVVGFVSTARYLSEMGWHSCPGGDA